MTQFVPLSRSNWRKLLRENMYPAFTGESCDKANYICGRIFIFLVYKGIYVNISPVLLVTRSESLSGSCLLIKNTIFLNFDNFSLIVIFLQNICLLI
jgi:hypothetical protein